MGVPVADDIHIVGNCGVNDRKQLCHSVGGVGVITVDHVP